MCTGLSLLLKYCYVPRPILTEYNLTTYYICQLKIHAVICWPVRVTFWNNRISRSNLILNRDVTWGLVFTIIAYPFPYYEGTIRFWLFSKGKILNYWFPFSRQKENHRRFTSQTVKSRFNEVLLYHLTKVSSEEAILLRRFINFRDFVIWQVNWLNAFVDKPCQLEAASVRCLGEQCL